MLLIRYLRIYSADDKDLRVYSADDKQLRVYPADDKELRVYSADDKQLRVYSADDKELPDREIKSVLQLYMYTYTIFFLHKTGQICH